MVPNLPYFMVQFDHKGEKGYGHVIEGAGDATTEDGGLEEGEKGGGEFPRCVFLGLRLRIDLYGGGEGTLQGKSLVMCWNWSRGSGGGPNGLISGVTRSGLRSLRRSMISLIGRG
jgi:hypothetical protein